MKQILYIFIFIFYSYVSYADDNQQKQIDNLFNQLKTTTNYENSKKIESKIWELWSTHPSENSLTALLEDGSSYVSQNKLGHTDKTSNEAIYGPLAHTILSAVLCYGLADKIYI